MRCLSRDQQGTAFIELAIVLPILVLVFVGVMELGSAMNEKILMQRGARHIARTIVRTKTPTLVSAATTTACEFLNSLALEPSNFSLSVEPLGDPLVDYAYGGFTPKGFILDTGTVYVGYQVELKRVTSPPFTIVGIFAPKNKVSSIFQSEPIIQAGVLKGPQLLLEDVILDGGVC